MNTSEEITNAWLNGNRKDVIAHLANSHPIVTANLVEFFRAWVPSWHGEWASLRVMLQNNADNTPVASQEPAQSPIESRVDELLSETECGYCSDDFDDADLCEDCRGRFTS